MDRLYLIAAPLGALLFALTTWSWSLRNRMARRTEDLITQRKLSAAHIERLNRVLRATRHFNRLMIREQDRDTLIREGCRLLVEQYDFNTALILLTDEHDRPETWATAGLEEECARLEESLGRSQLPAYCLAAKNSREKRPGSGGNPSPGGCAGPSEPAECNPLCVQLRHGEITLGYLAVTASRDSSADPEERGLLEETAGDLACALIASRERAARSIAEKARNDVQQQLVKAQKLEAVGQLAGGVAHDFNNILQVMMGHTQLLIDEANQKGAASGDLLEIYRGTERAAALTRQLLSFSRRQVMQPRRLDLNALTENSLGMLRRVIGDQIRLEWFPANALDVVRADPAMIEQVLTNLCANARDAMPHEGAITIRTRNARIDAAYCLPRTFAREGNFVVLSVVDTGCGMDEEVLNHIFEPFFTTKDVGSGSGLGLATVHGIIRQHEGWVEVASKPGHGTEFSIFLPAQVPAPATTQELPPPGAASGGTETILLVEDESSLRALTRRFLEGKGYIVIEACSGREALEIWPQHRDRVDLLMTDLVMPEGVSGRQLSDRLLKDKPSLSVLLTSGYCPEVAGKDTSFGLRRNSQFLAKPYATRDLLKAIRLTLGNG